MSAHFRTRNYLLITAATVMLLTGCDALTPLKHNETIKGNFEGNKTRLQDMTKSAVSSDPLSVSNDVWIGNQAIRMRSGQPLPSKLDNDHGFVLVSNAPMTLPMIATQIANSTNIPVRLGDMTLSGGDASSPFGATTTSGGNDSSAMSISYEGSLATFLDQVASQFDVAWRYDGRSIYLYRYESKTFSVEAMPGKGTTEDEFDTGSGGGSGGAAGGGSSSSQDMTQTNKTQTEMDYWKDIDTTIKGILGGEGSLTVMQSSGTITVTARPAKLAQVSQFLDAENNRLSKQIAIDVTVYNVTMRDTDSYGINLTTVFDGGVFGDPGSVSLTSPIAPLDPSGISQGTLSIALLSGDFDVTAIPRFLSTVGNVSVVTRSPIVTLNNRAASRKISVDRAYAASTSTTLTDGGSQASVTPGTINTGFALQLLPRMMPDGRILLQYSIRMSELLGEPVAFGPTGNQIQLPEVDNKVFVQQAVLQNGSTLVLAGFERNRDASNSRGIGSATNWLLGGGFSNDKNREQLVITITPRDISPERGSTRGS